MESPSPRPWFMLFLLPMLLSTPFLSAGPVTVAGATYDLGTAYNSESKIVSDQNGNLFVAYSSLSANGTYYVKVSRSGDGGGTWSPLPGVPSGPFSSRSAMAITRTGSLGLVWTEGVTEFSQIYFSSFNGGTWSPKVLLSNSRFYSGYPSIAADSRGDFHVVWYGFDGISYQIYYARWNGSSWSAPLDISALKQDSLNPSIAIDSGDNIYVAWYAEVVHNYQVLFTYYSGNWSRTIPLTVATLDSSNPALAVEPDGRLNLVWISTIGRTDQVFTMTRTDGTWGPEHQLTNGTQYASDPTQAFTSNGTEFVFWVLGNGLFGCAFVGSCTPRPVFTDGFNSFPIAVGSPAYPESVFLMWSHSDSGDLNPSSVLFARVGAIELPENPWALAAPVLVVLAVVAVFLIASRGKEHERG